MHTDTRRSRHRRRRASDMRNCIKTYRIKNGLTQEALARAAGVRRETIVFLEQGKYNPSLRLAHDVAAALDTTIEELFLFDE